MATGGTVSLVGSVTPYYLMSMGCMGLKNGLYIFMIRQFFRNIPKDIEEAAYVDGCGTLRTFLTIMLLIRKNTGNNFHSPFTLFRIGR